MEPQRPARDRNIYIERDRDTFFLPNDNSIEYVYALAIFHKGLQKAILLEDLSCSYASYMGTFSDAR